MVKTHKLPAYIYETLCFRCGAKVEFPLFQASFYNFATYQETHSGQIFRLDLDACHYQKRTIEDLLLEAQKIIEDRVDSPNWIELPERIKCHRCGDIFPYGELKGVSPSREDDVDAYPVPAA
jgi:hypothetical protein